MAIRSHNITVICTYGLDTLPPKDEEAIEQHVAFNLLLLLPYHRNTSWKMAPLGRKLDGTPVTPMKAKWRRGRSFWRRSISTAAICSTRS